MQTSQEKKALEELSSIEERLRTDLAAVEAGGGADVLFESIIACAYACIDSNTSSASPYFFRAKVILESTTLNAQQRARGMLTLLSALLGDCRSTGYRIPIDEPTFYDAFGRHSASLRNWLIAFGIGAPALLLTHETLIARLLASGSALLIASLFLGGVLLQIVKAFLFKFTAWSARGYADTADHRASHWMRFSIWLHESMLFDVGFDLVTLMAFLIAAWKTAIILTDC